MHDLVRCTCTRINDPWRKFCGGCGKALAPHCDQCGFVNARTDRFCGGCGSKVTDALAAGTVSGTPRAIPREMSRAHAIPRVPTPIEPNDSGTIPIEILDVIQ